MFKNREIYMLRNVYFEVSYLLSVNLHFDESLNKRTCFYLKNNLKIYFFVEISQIRNKTCI
jgi:hypothetical protein